MSRPLTTKLTRYRDLVMCGPHSLPPSPPHHVLTLTDRIVQYRKYLEHADPAVRLTGLRGIAEAVDTLITKEYTAARPAAAPQPERLRRLLTVCAAHLRRFLP